MVWGTYLEKNYPSSDGHLLDFEGSRCLPGWFGALFLEKDWTALQKGRIGPEKKCPRVPVWVRGVQLLFGQYPNELRFFGGASVCN